MIFMRNFRFYVYVEVGDEGSFSLPNYLLDNLLFLDIFCVFLFVVFFAKIREICLR